MQLFEHPYSNFLQSVEKPTRYTGAEHGTRRKDWQSVDARVCLAFPDIYDIGMSHLGFRMLYKILNDNPRTLAERAYTPWIDMQRELALHGKLLLSLESARPLCDFDVVGFSLQYELTYTNILSMLQLSGIPLRTSQRGEDDPLIVAGGPVATHMEPMAIFLDAVLVGDGEEATTEIALSWTQGKKRGLTRAERLRELANIRGVYVPSLYDTLIDPETSFEVVSGAKLQGVPFPVERRLLANISKFPFPDDGPVGGPEAIFDRMSIEVARGCTEGCRFCQAGMIYRPVRERSPQSIAKSLLDGVDKAGYDETGLTCLSTADFSSITPLVKSLAAELRKRGVSIAFAPRAAGETCVRVLGASGGATPANDNASPKTLAERCTYGVTWPSALRWAPSGTVATLAVQPLASWTELWVMRHDAATDTWTIETLTPATTEPDVGYVESAGFSPDGAHLLVVREARVAGHATRKFQVLAASTLAVELQCTDVTKLSAFKRWQAAWWKAGTLALR